MKPSTNAAIKLLVFTFAAIALAALLVWILPSCSSAPARVSNPAAIYDLSAAEYNAAENHFAGASVVLPAVYWDDARCQTLLDQRDAFALVATIAGGLAGAGGVSTAVTDKDVPQRALGLSSLVAGALSAGFAGAATSKTRRFETYCNTTPAAPVVIDLEPMPSEWEADAGADAN